MEGVTELYNQIYEILCTQLQLGVYRYMYSLPTIEEASEQFSVSIDTVRLAYLRLKKEGYIWLTKNVGAKAMTHYAEQEIERHIVDFFAPQKDAFIDLGKSMRPLFGNILRIGLKHAPPKTWKQMEQYLDSGGRKLTPCAIWQHLEQRYSSFETGC